MMSRGSGTLNHGPPNWNLPGCPFRRVSASAVKKPPVLGGAWELSNIEVGPIAELDALRTVRQEVRRELLAEGKKHQAWKRLCQIPSIGPIRSAVLLGILQNSHRFRTKRQLWAYSGFGIETQAARITVVSTGSSSEQSNRAPFADGTETAITI
jgi:transposase IS116/IS110/IS902 family protein